MSAQSFNEFNKFQTLFYTNIEEFNRYTDFEIRQNSFVLLNNLIKGYPYLATKILDIYSPDVKSIESPAIIIALQRKFVNNFSRARVPQHVYFKSLKVKSDSKSKVKTKSNKNEKILYDFDGKIALELKSKLMIDEKTYQYLKYTDKIQFLGLELIKEFENKEKRIFENTKK